MDILYKDSNKNIEVKVNVNGNKENEDTKIFQRNDTINNKDKKVLLHKVSSFRSNKIKNSSFS